MYLNKKNCYIGKDYFSIGLRKDNSEWIVDTNCFGNIPAKALTGKLKKVVKALIKDTVRKGN